jgi:hypothetical protein
LHPFPSRRHRDVRCLPALVPQAGEGGRLLRHASPRVHLRTRRVAVLSDARRRVHRAHRAADARAAVADDPGLQGERAT